MREWFWATIWPILQQNQFAQGGLLLGVVGGVIAYFRALPQRIWRFVVHKTSVRLEVRSTDAFFFKLRRWFDANQTKFRYVRSFNAQESTNRDSKTFLIPGRGSHLMWWRGRPVRLVRSVDNGNTPSGFSGQQVESYVLQLFFSRKQDLLDLVAEMETFADHQSKRQLSLYISGTHGWNGRRLPHRSFSSVVLPEGQAERVLADMQHFWAARRYYRERSLPYRRGYLFLGPPGTGKTSLVIALARKMRVNVQMISLAEATDTSFRAHMNEVSKRSIVLLEDVDAVDSALVSRTTKDDDDDVTSTTTMLKPVAQRLSLMTVLNTLDGLFAPEGVIIIMTTNHPEKLDPALIRPGRVDVRVPFTYADDDQLIRLYKQFNGEDWSYPEAKAWLKTLERPIAMCSAQASLISARKIATLEAKEKEEPELVH